MGKISNAIQMLNYLNTGNKYSVKELSKKIGITERMVRYYKVEIEQAGIPIETFMGPNGGYYILNTKNQYNHFNKYDLQLLENINMILEKIGYEDIVKYKKIINKIKFASDVEEEKSKYFLDSATSDKSELYFSSPYSWRDPYSQNPYEDSLGIFDLNRRKILECLAKNGDYSKKSEILYVKRMVKNESN